MCLDMQIVFPNASVRFAGYVIHSNHSVEFSNSHDKIKLTQKISEGIIEYGAAGSSPGTILISRMNFVLSGTRRSRWTRKRTEDSPSSFTDSDDIEARSLSFRRDSSGTIVTYRDQSFRKSGRHYYSYSHG